MVVKTFTVPVRGVGRRDYSSGIEFSVEPVIRSYQDVYPYWDTLTVAPGSSETKDVEIGLGYMVLLYDFFATHPTNQMISLSVFTVAEGVAGRVVEESKHGSISKHLSKGFPFFEIIRFKVENMGEDSLDINIGTMGIITSREEYFLLSPGYIAP